jgi:hypothetical protein
VERRRQAAAKTVRETEAAAKQAAKAPLFRAQILAEVRTPEENYERTYGWHPGEGGGDREPYVGFFEDWQTVLLRCVALRVLDPEVYRVACAWSAGRWFAFPVQKWTDLLLGRARIVLKRYRHVFGCTHSIPSRYYDGPPFIVEKRVEIGDMVVWPPDGWQPPLTPEQLKELLAEPPPGEQPDDGGLARLVEQVIANSRKDLDEHVCESTEEAAARGPEPQG